MIATWEIRLDKNHDDVWAEFQDLEGWYEAVVKWDGCIDFHSAANVEFSDEFGHSGGPRDKAACDNYIHICDIDDMIERLQSLKIAALAHFGEWPRC